MTFSLSLKTPKRGTSTFARWQGPFGIVTTYVDATVCPHKCGWSQESFWNPWAMTKRVQRIQLDSNVFCVSTYVRLHPWTKATLIQVFHGCNPGEAI